MILTITPNPLLDYIIYNERQPSSGGHRVDELCYTVGGKGINVARMLKTLGKPPLALTFSGGENGVKMQKKLVQQGIFARFVDTSVETRVGINCIVQKPQNHTWWIEKGQEITEKEIVAMLSLIQLSISKTNFVAMSGSIPGINNSDFYARALKTLKNFRGEIYIDATGDALSLACEVGGFFLKHNRDEAIESFQLDPFDRNETKSFFSKLLANRILSALITDGEREAIFWDGIDIHRFKPAPAKLVSSVGCGDASLAGLLYGRASGMSLIDSVKWGLAAGAADAECSGPCEAEFNRVASKLHFL